MAEKLLLLILGNTRYEMMSNMMSVSTGFFDTDEEVISLDRPDSISYGWCLTEESSSPGVTPQKPARTKDKVPMYLARSAFT